MKGTKILESYQRGSPFSNTYYINSRNHPDHKWAINFTLNLTEGTPQNAPAAQPRKPSRLEEMLGQLIMVTYNSFKS